MTGGGPEYGSDLEQICAIPGLKWLVCEYCTDAHHPRFKAFVHYARRYGKQLSTFVNVGFYDATKPGHVRYEGTLDDFRRAVEFCFSQNAAGLTASPADSFYPFSEAFHPERVRVWDEIFARALSGAASGGPRPP